MAFWYNVDTGAVETDDDRSQNANVMGPYDTQEAAQNALSHARENTEKWDAEDRAWEDGRSESSRDDSDLED